MAAPLRVVALLSVPWALGCSASRQSECEAIRDRFVATQRVQLEATLSALESEQRAPIRARVSATLAAFEARFVGECVRLEGTPLFCFEDPGPAPEVCQSALNEMWEVIQLGLPEPR